MKLPLAKDFNARCVSCGKQISSLTKDLDIPMDRSPLLCGTPVGLYPLKGSNFSGYGIHFCICDHCLGLKIAEGIVIQTGTVDDLVGPLRTD
jgi:hypothetical protein